MTTVYVLGNSMVFLSEAVLPEGKTGTLSVGFSGDARDALQYADKEGAEAFAAGLYEKTRFRLFPTPYAVEE